MEIFEGYSGLISFLALVTTALFAIPAYLRSGPLPDLKERIATPKARTELRADIGTGLAPSYFRAIEGVTQWADGFYGEKLISIRAFDRCLYLALLYPVVAALIGWAGWNLHSPGGNVLFPDMADPIARLWRSALILFVAVGVYLCVTKYEWFDEQVTALVVKGHARLKQLENPQQDPPKWLIFMGFVISLSTFGALAGLFGYTFARVFPSGDVRVFNYALAGAAAVAATGAVFVTIPIVLGVAFVLYNMQALDGVTVMLFYFALLPLCNAVGDMGSVAATRLFLGRICRRRPGVLVIALSLLVDIVVAVTFLALLLLLIVSTLDLWAARFPATLPLDWRAYWAALQADRANGVALYLMLATTLLPTLMHLVAGIGALFTHRSRLNTRALRALDALEAAGHEPEPAECTSIAKQLLNARLYGWALALALLAALLYAASHLPVQRLREVLDAVFGSV